MRNGRPYMKVISCLGVNLLVSMEIFMAFAYWNKLLNGHALTLQ